MTFLPWYGQWNVLVGVLAISVAWLRPTQNFSRWLKWSYALTLLSLAVPLLTPYLSHPDFISPSARDWVASGLHPQVRQSFRVTQFALKAQLSSPQTAWRQLILLALLVGTGVRTALFFRAVGKLVALRKSAFAWKRIGKISLLIADDVPTPFSFRGLSRRYIVFPASLVPHREELRLALRHESQHHRQGDTLFVYGLEGMKALLWCNPFSFLLARKLSELQEFACDEAATRGHRAQAYVRCLLTVIQNQGNSRFRLVGTTGLAVGNSASLLKRRIQMLFNPKTKSRARLTFLVVPFLVASGLMFALSSDIPDRVITEAEATQLAGLVNRSGEFPVTINPHVLKYLNYFVGTPKGREFMKNALTRMETYRPMIEQKLRQYQLPTELMAMPLIESGYQNLPEKGHYKSAGVWQITPQTGDNFGLKPIDRLNVDLATDMALRLLSADYLRFQTWELSVVAYNAGENKVQDGITETGSRDAWFLIDHGYGGDEGYLAKFMAAVIIMKSPNILQ